MRPVFALPAARPVRRGFLPIATVLLLTALGSGPAQSEAASTDKRLVLAAAASLEESGLLDHLLPIFQRTTGIAVTVIAQPAGAALRLAREGKVDAVLVDDYDQEVKAIEDGSCVDRRDIMYSDLVLVGPPSDPAGVEGMASIIDAAKLIAGAQAPFVARGDDSHVAATERGMWDEAEIAVGGEATRSWYVATGGDAARSLGAAASRGAYTLADRASWLRFRNRGRLQIMVQDDPRLVVQFGAMAVNPARYPGLHAASAKAFIEWLSSKDGQAAILQFHLQDAVPFVPNYGERSGAEPPRGDRGE